MKKIYIKPTLSQYIIESKQSLLSGSATFTGGLGSTDTDGTDGGNALSRQSTSLWDDEE
jgi:hypothetical protein